MSDWYDFPRYPKTTRREAKDGIKARSRRGDIGERWWSRRFVEALESFANANRLRRGRSYARSGQVMDLDVESGLVTARVQGSRKRPYTIRAEIDRFDDDEWSLAEDAIAAQALFLAALLAGEMPADIEDAFDAAGLELFPRSHADLRTECSCPDWANPCKHIAATLYILAEAFDDDPFLILAWRGRDRDTLIERLRERRAGAGPEATSGASPGTSSATASIAGTNAEADGGGGGGSGGDSARADAHVSDESRAAAETGDEADDAGGDDSRSDHAVAGAPPVDDDAAVPDARFDSDPPLASSLDDYWRVGPGLESVTVD
ncbi:MAG: SWIM zinc finger family protein, partial [Gemmatimonadota bacterium]